MSQAAPLRGRVALVTGATRGVGRGIAVGLAEAGASVVVTGRTAGPGQSAWAGSLAETAAMVDAAGGRAVPIACDHRDDRAVEAVFATIARDLGRLDLLVNNVTALPDLGLLFTATPFWDVPTAAWDNLFDVGLRSHFVAAQHAARLMVGRREGLIVNVSSAGAQSRWEYILPYGVAKAALDRMTSDMATDLKPHGVTVVSLWPPPTRTEGMLRAAGEDDDPAQWSEPVFTGRVIAALSVQPGLAGRSGSVLRARQLAAELGVQDVL